MYKLIQYDFSGESTEYEPIEISTIYDTTTDNLSWPISLQQNYPNPFNPSTIIEYELRITSFVDISIFNSLGQKIVTLVSQMQNSGTHHVEWNAGNLSSGIYFYIINAGEFQAMRKMVLIR